MCPGPPCRCRATPPAAVSSSYLSVLAEHLLDPADRLPRSSFILDHREADILVAELAEADSGRHRDFRPRKKLLREFERARGTIRLGNPCPHVHRRLRGL